MPKSTGRSMCPLWSMPVILIGQMQQDVTLYFLLYERYPMFPIAIDFGVRTTDLTTSTTSNYVEKFHKRLEWAYKLLRSTRKSENAQKSSMIMIFIVPNFSVVIWSQ